QAAPAPFPRRRPAPRPRAPGRKFFASAPEPDGSEQSADGRARSGPRGPGSGLVRSSWAHLRKIGTIVQVRSPPVRPTPAARRARALIPLVGAKRQPLYGFLARVWIKAKNCLRAHWISAGRDGEATMLSL